MNVAKTARTIINYNTLDDASFFLTLANSPDWLRYIGERIVTNVQDACQYLENGLLQFYSDNRYGYYVVRTALDRVPIGICGFLKRQSLENPDFGFAFLPEYYGQGFAIESCRAVLEFGIGTFGFSVLDAVTSLENVRSIRLLEKLGLLQYGTVDGDNSEDQLTLYRWQQAI